MSDDPIYATPPRKKPGPKPGSRRLLPVPQEKEEGQCPCCARTAAPIGLELLRELVRSARDRLLDDESNEAKHDLLYLAARLDGYCSLTCWRKTQ
jgi:hypothetical protein